MPLYNPPALGTTGVTNGQYRFLPANSERWRAGVANARDGVRPAKILMIGDSDFAGIGSTNYATQPDSGSPCTRLASVLTSLGLPATRGFSAPGPNNFWTYGASWSTTFFGFGSLSCATSLAGGNALVYADNRINADKFDVYVMTGSGQGTLTATATGGTPVAINCNTGTGIAKITCIAASKATTNTVSIACTVAQSYVVGIEPFDSALITNVRIANAGIGTTGAVEHATANTTWGTVPMLNAYQPDLTVVGLGINDRGNARTFAQYATAMDTVVNAAVAVSSVMLCTQMPSGSTPASTNEAQFNAYMFGRNDCMLYDYYSRCQTFAKYNTRGFAFDFLHPNDFGYWDEAQGIGSALMANI